MKHASSPTTALSRRGALLFALASLLGGSAAALGACTEAPPDSLAGEGATSSGAGEGGSGGASLSNGGEALFRELEASFVEACAACHDAGGIANTPFLAGPDRYQSVLSWPGIVSKEPEASVLVTHAVTGGGHSGVNLDSGGLESTLLPAIEGWLAEEAKGIAAPPADSDPAIDPVTPILGFNALYLDALGEAFAGMAITFTAEELGEGSLLLSELEVHPTAKTGVHLVHPLFVVYPKAQGPDPDPVDSFSNLDQRFEAGASAALGPGALVLTNWQSKAKVSVAFEVIEELSSGAAGEGGAGGGGPVSGCKDLGSFQENAAGPLGTCAGCHGGANGMATAAVDMSALGSDDATACAQILHRVNPDDPSASQLFVTTSPSGNAAHPYKFNGNNGAFMDFKSALTPWIMAEQ